MIVARGVSVDQRAGVPALADLSFEVGPGSVYALLSRQSALKTLVTRILRGTLRTAAGSFTVDGIDVSHNPRAARRRIAFASQTTGMYDDLSPARSARLLARLSGVTPTRRAVTDALRLAGLPERLIHAPARRLDASHRLAVGVGVGVLRGATTFVLEDPTDAGDARTLTNVADMLAELRALDRAVLITTSDVSLATSADRIGLLRNGEIGTECSPKELMAWSLPDFLVEFGSQAGPTQRPGPSA